MYADMYQLCEEITKSYGSKQYFGIGSRMQKLANYERDCRSKGFQFLKREWLTSTEYDALYFRTQTLLKKQTTDVGRKSKEVRRHEMQQKGNVRQK